MTETYPQKFSASEAIIERWGKPIGELITIREPNGNLRQTSSAHRLGLTPDVRVYLNRRLPADLGRIASMRATWYVPEEDIESMITIGCKYVSPVLSDEQRPVLLEREYRLHSDPANNRIEDLPTGPNHPTERSVDLERPAQGADAAFIEAMLTGIADYYPLI